MILLVLASILWSVSFALIGAHNIDSDLLAAARLGLAFLLFAPLLVLRPSEAGVSASKRLRLAAIGGLQYGVMYVLVLRAYDYLAGHEVALLTITTPIFVVVVDALLSRRAAMRAWVASAVAIAAAYVLRDGGVRVGTETAGFWTGVWLVQGANLAWAAGQVLYRRVEPDSPATASRFAWLFLGGFAVALARAVQSVPAEALQLSGGEIAVVLYLGLVPSGVAFYLWNRGATRVDVGTLAVMNNLKIPLAVAVALLPPFSEEANLGRLAASSVLLLVALVLATGGTRARAGAA